MLRLFVGAAGTGAFLFGYMLLRARKTQICRHEFGFFESSWSINLLFVSDIHKQRFTDRDLASGEKVDLVLIGGDLTESGAGMKSIEHNLRVLSSIAPVYFVWGNNDYSKRNVLKKAFSRYFINELNNTGIHVEEGNWTLAGVEDRSLKRHNLSHALEGAEGPVLLVSHDPGIVSEFPVDHQVRLVLSGHTHGGQIRLGCFSLAPPGGVYLSREVTLLVSNGCGTTKLPLRFFCSSADSFYRLETEEVTLLEVTLSFLYPLLNVKVINIREAGDLYYE